MLENYTALDLKNQMFTYILENYYSNEKLRDILNNHMAETLLLGGSLCTWVEKINRPKWVWDLCQPDLVWSSVQHDTPELLSQTLDRHFDWGDLKLINVISLMLNLKISILDYVGGTANIERWHFGGQKTNLKRQMSYSFTMDLLILLEQVILL